MSNKDLYEILAARYKYIFQNYVSITTTDQRSNRRANLLDLAHVHFVDANSQTEKSTSIRRIGVRETSVFRHNRALIEGPLKPLNTIEI